MLRDIVQFLADRYGFTLKLEKLEGPLPQLPFTGWDFDISPSLSAPSVSIPPGKRERFFSSAERTLAHPARIDLDKFVGKVFNFASVFPGLRPVALRINAHRHSLPAEGPGRLRPQPLTRRDVAASCYRSRTHYCAAA
eukprot:gb/GEZN01010845.1/.p1 GENE.gb/GEZN01010845.1/~~gb/GEZN01010845.1/.p1  ORF type:complete len:138 (+),score=8.29 gb/GEZN01010845.1/:386-799(+)